MNRFILKKGGWEELADFESWLQEKLGDELFDVYGELPAVFQTNLYGVFCELADGR